MVSDPHRSDGSGRRWLIFLAALIAVASTARLGVWQLDRAAQKAALQQAIDSRSAMPALPQRALAVAPADAPAQYQRRILLTGQWLAAATVFLDNRQIDGRPGFFVMTPLRLQPAPGGSGAAAGPVLVWVQRGWVPRDNDDRSRLPLLQTPAGDVEVEGRIAPPPARLFEFAGEEAGPIRQNLDLAASARSLRATVLPLTVLQTGPPAGGAGDGLVRNWPSPSTGIEKHHGYAFQWFALSTLITGLYVWFQLVRRWRPARSEKP